MDCLVGMKKYMDWMGFEIRRVVWQPAGPALSPKEWAVVRISLGWALVACGAMTVTLRLVETVDWPWLVVTATLKVVNFLMAIY